MTRYRYKADFLLKLYTSPLIAAPEGMPLFEEWYGEYSHSNPSPARRGRKNDKSTNNTHASGNTSALSAQTQHPSGSQPPRSSASASEWRANKQQQQQQQHQQNSSSQQQQQQGSQPEWSSTSSNVDSGKAYFTPAPQEDSIALFKAEMRRKEGLAPLPAPQLVPVPAHMPSAAPTTSSANFFDDPLLAPAPRRKAQPQHQYPTMSPPVIPSTSSPENYVSYNNSVNFSSNQNSNQDPLTTGRSSRFAHKFAVSPEPVAVRPSAVPTQNSFSNQFPVASPEDNDMARLMRRLNASSSTPSASTPQASLNFQQPNHHFNAQYARTSVSPLPMSQASAISPGPTNTSLLSQYPPAGLKQDHARMQQLLYQQQNPSQQDQSELQINRLLSQQSRMSQYDQYPMQQDSRNWQQSQGALPQPPPPHQQQLQASQIEKLNLLMAAQPQNAPRPPPIQGGPQQIYPNATSYYSGMHPASLPPQSFPYNTQPPAKYAQPRRAQQQSPPIPASSQERNSQLLLQQLMSGRM